MSSLEILVFVRRGQSLFSSAVPGDGVSNWAVPRDPAMRNVPYLIRTALFVFLHRPRPAKPQAILSDRNATDVLASIL